MRRPLRILVAHNVSGQRTGGMSRLMSFVHDEVARKGHTVDYLCAEDVPSWLQGGKARFTFPLAVLRRAAAAARARKPYDVVNVHEPSGAAIGLLKKLVGGPRVVATSYGLEERCWARRIEESRLGRETVRLKSRLLYPTTLLWQARLALVQSDHIFCSNMDDRDYLTSKLRIPAAKITRIHSGADRVYSEAGSTRDYSTAVKLLFAGTWISRKGTGDLIPAFAKLAALHPELRLVALNGGVPDSAIRECFPTQLRSRVLCEHAQPEKGIVDVLSDTDIYLLPSLFEGTPLTLIEAMFAGMPIVTTATCGMKDVIEDGKNGLLVPIRSPDAIVGAVNRLLSDAQLRAKLGQTARCEALQKYNWQRVAEPICEVYEQLSTGKT